MTAYRLQIIEVCDDGSCLVQAWGIPAEEAGRLRSILPEPDIEAYSPAEVVDKVTDAAEGRVVFTAPGEVGYMGKHGNGNPPDTGKGGSSGGGKHGSGSGGKGGK